VVDPCHTGASPYSARDTLPSCPLMPNVTTGRSPYRSSILKQVRTRTLAANGPTAERAGTAANSNNAQGGDATVPCPPELTAMINAHVELIGYGPNDRLFVGSARGGTA
jgi:hypothetical protein